MLQIRELAWKAGYGVTFKISFSVNGKAWQLRRVVVSNRVGTLGQNGFWLFQSGVTTVWASFSAELFQIQPANYGAKLLPKKMLRARARWTVLSRRLLVPQALSSNPFASITIYPPLRKDGRLNIRLEKASCCWPHSAPFSMWNVSTIQL